MVFARLAGSAQADPAGAAAGTNPAPQAGEAAPPPPATGSSATPAGEAATPPLQQPRRTGKGKSAPKRSSRGDQDAANPR